MAILRKLSRCSLQLNHLTSGGRAFRQFLAVWMVAGTIYCNQAYTQSTTTEAPLTVEEVVKLSKAGFSEELLVTKIKKNGKAFDLNPDELVELRREGLSENVIKVLLDPTAAYTPPAPPPVTVPAKKYPADSLASAVPPDPGLYFFSGSTPSSVDIKLLLGMHKGKVLKSKAVAYLAGPAAKLRIKAGKPVFYLRMPEGKEISDVILISLLGKGDRRELDGLPGSKGGLNSDDVVQFDHAEVGAKLFKLSPPALDEGEYLFFFAGSAEPDKGTYGKGYDFGIDAAVVEKKK